MLLSQNKVKLLEIAVIIVLIYKRNNHTISLGAIFFFFGKNIRVVTTDSLGGVGDGGRLGASEMWLWGVDNGGRL